MTIKIKYDTNNNINITNKKRDQHNNNKDNDSKKNNLSTTTPATRMITINIIDTVKMFPKCFGEAIFCN